ncbi:MAG: Uma2 family endonuclease [Planctomycetia bacterium]
MVTASGTEIGSPTPGRHRITVDEFYRLAEAGILRADDRVELIDGEVCDMSPIGIMHAAVVAAMAAAFHEAFGRSLVIWMQNLLRLDAASELQPDICLLAQRADFYRSRPPGPADARLVVEVADSSLSHDLGVKVPLLARHGVPEVWVVEATTRRTHRFRRPEEGRYAACDVVEPTELLEFAQFRGALAALLP